MPYSYSINIGVQHLFSYIILSDWGPVLAFIRGEIIHFNTCAKITHISLHLWQLLYFWIAARKDLAPEAFWDLVTWFLFPLHNVWESQAKIPLPFPKNSKFLGQQTNFSSAGMRLHGCYILFSLVSIKYIPLKGHCLKYQILPLRLMWFLMLLWTALKVLLGLYIACSLLTVCCIESCQCALPFMFFVVSTDMFPFTAFLLIHMLMRFCYILF